MDEAPAWIERVPEQATAMADRIFSAAQPSAVWNEPVQSDGYTVITASEVSAGGGFGFGFGSGPRPTARESVDPGQHAPEPSGGGSGGGGGSMGRPVGIVVIGPDGVAVRPIVDVTKIALAALTASGAVLLMLIKLR